jgi:alkanesulfonate monooxygenase SsuD/methylene tetrahydromethanopterin reductase-like flavin-dependent oxidoreductase (luciferase family)
MAGGTVRFAIHETHQLTGVTSMPPLFGYHMPSYTFPATPPHRLFERVAELSVAAEAAGFGLVTVMDHFYQIPGVGAETEPMLEAYSTLARSRRPRCASGARHGRDLPQPILAKTVTTLDVISGGRAILGIGAAWNEDEHRGYGVEFPPVRERMERLDEALTICRAMFTEERPTFEGRHYRVAAALNVPRPVSPGGPPIRSRG